jgi:LysM repeat protein
MIMQNATGRARVVSAKSREQLHRVRLLTFAYACLVIGATGCGNIPGRYQLAARPLEDVPTGTNQPAQVTYTVAAGDTASTIATAIAATINGDAGFHAAGVIAKASDATISFTLPQSFKLTSAVVPPADHVTAVIKDGPPVTLTIAGSPQAGDTITIAGGVSSSQNPSASTPPPSGASKPLAAIGGRGPAQ